MFHVEQSEMKTIEKCPICGGQSLQNHLVTRDFFFTNEEFTLDKCSDCEFVFTNPIPTNIGRYYETDDYLSHAAERKNIITKIYKEVRNINIKKKYNIVENYSKGKKILDIGCGTGELLSYFKMMNWETLGIEPNDSARNFALIKYNLIIKKEESITTIPEKSFDAITMWHVLEHVPSLNDRMQEIRRICKDNGTIFIALPNMASPDSIYYDKYWAGLAVPRHLYHFTKETFEKLATKHKMKVVKSIPMKFDAYYVSMLSEKYMNHSFGKLRALIHGFLSNAKAKHTNNYSSMIFVLKKINN